MNQKGNINKMMPMIIIFFVIAVGFALTSFVFDNIKTTQVSNSTEWNTTNSVSEGVGVFADLMPAAGVIVGIVFIILIIIAFTSSIMGRK